MITFAHMTNLRRIFFSLTICLFCELAPAQDAVSWDDFISDYAVEDDNSAAWTEVYDLLSELHDHPMNINTATREELGRLPFLSDRQIEDIEAYIHSYGAMKTAGELLMVESLDNDTRQRLLPFITFGPPQSKGFPTFKELISRGKNELLASLSIPCYERKGNDNGYIGSKYRHSLRYELTSGNYLKAGIIGAQGDGEPFFKDKNRLGYDYYSYYLVLHDLGRFSTVALGRYKASFGMGLVVNSSFSLGKTAALSSLGRTGNNLRAHSSQSEDGYFNGIATAIKVNKIITVSAFASHKGMDATLNDDGSMATIITSGYHRTAAELEKKNNSKATDVGGNINIAYKDMHLGVTALYTAFNRTLSPNTSLLYKQHAPQGTHFLNTSIDYGYVSRRLSFRGETATGDCGGIATLNHLNVTLSSRLNVMMLQRYYSYRYAALRSNAFSEGGSVQNESGIYLGTEWRPAYPWRITAYTDWFRFAWPRYQVSQASHGSDHLLSVGYKKEKWNIETRYRLHIRQKDNEDKNGLNNNVTQRFRLRVGLLAGKRMTLQTQMDATRLSATGTPEYGYMINEKVGYAFTQTLSASLCYGYFHTDSYASRVCVYEQGLLYRFSFPSFYGEGTRLAMIIKGQIAKNITLIAKAGITDYFDRARISSGLQEINHSSQTDCDLQLHWKF